MPSKIKASGIIALSTLVSLLISWRYTEQSGSPIGEFAAIVLSATLGAMLLCGSTDLISVFISLETLSVASYLPVSYTHLTLPTTGIV